MEVAALRLRRTFETIAFRVVEPAVIAAGNTALLDAAIRKRRPAMRAAVLQKTDASLLVLKQDQIFAEDAHELDRLLLGNIRGDRDRMPVPAQQLARGRPGSDARKHLVFFSCQHGITSAAIRMYSLTSRRIKEPPGAGTF